MKNIEEKYCQNEGAFKTIIFKGFQPFVMQLVFLILFHRYTYIVSKCPQKSTKECRGYLF